MNSSIRPLLIVEGANPELTSASLVGWSCAKAVASVTQAHLVTQWRNRDAFLRAGLREGEDFTAIDNRFSQSLAWRAANAFSKKGAFSWSLYAALSNVAYPWFERAVWKQFGERLKCREFDVVHRILPLSPTTPSWLASRLKSAGIPFVLGPLNGGVPWPKGFDQVRRAEKDGFGRFRPLHRLLPGIQSTQHHAAAILAGARSVLNTLPRHLHSKTVFIPENAIDQERFTIQSRSGRQQGPLRLAFVGRLVALKGVDMLLEAIAPIARAGKVTVDIIGDGPERSELQQILDREGVGHSVKILGWLDHASVRNQLAHADALGFPSLREFGGGAVLEAMALGVPPIVLDHGGPPELVAPGTGFVLPLRSRTQIIHDLRALVAELADHPDSLRPIAVAGQAHVERYYTWQAKAAQILEVYRWILGKRADKPGWGIPMGHPQSSSHASEILPLSDSPRLAKPASRHVDARS